MLNLNSWLPFYRPYSFASQIFICFADNIIVFYPSDKVNSKCSAVIPKITQLLLLMRHDHKKAARITAGRPKALH